MAYLQFENGKTPINDTNLNSMQNSIETDIQEKSNGIVLYEDEIGSTGSITLTDMIENYKEIEIQSYVGYSGGNVYSNTGKIPVSSAGRIHLNNFFINASLNLDAYNKRISISGNSINVASDRFFSTGGGANNGTYTYITKVIAYK